MKTIFLRALEADDKAVALLAAIREPEGAHGKRRFEVDPISFASVPRSPFAYWVSDRVLQVFRVLQPLETGGRIVRIGLTTHDDFRWLRLTWESTCGSSRVPFAKGGEFSPYYADVHLSLPWASAGRLLKVSKLERLRLGELTENNSRCWNESLYFRPGLTWPRRTNGLSLRAMPAGCIFADKGPAAFSQNDDSQDLLVLAAITNSGAFALLVSLQLARTELAQSYEVGLIQSTPVPNLNAEERESFATFGRRSWSLRRSLDTCTETSHAFGLPALLQATGETLAERAAAWADCVRRVNTQLETIQTDIDHRCLGLYGIDEADQRAISEAFESTCDDANDETDADADDADSEDGDTEGHAEETVLAAELVSWMVAVAFGRFDVRLASGARVLPDEPEPFDPLPLSSPAMLTGDDGLPLTSAPAGYPLVFPENGILVDDPGQASDLTAAVRKVFDEVFNASADAYWNEATALLDPQGQDLRGWLASSFFEHHLKRYSKSRRKAPIIWQLAVPSGRYSVWLYAHRFTRDSFFQIQNDVVTPKLAHEERRLTSLMQSAGPNPSAKERKEIAAQEAIVAELRTMLDEVKRVAPLWNPTLDDGVVLSMAPLWRLVPQHKPWQKELKCKWDELAVGKYDWANIAMHLWPERVVPKCATDRSLAIAHGLEDIFWVEEEDGKWKPRTIPTKTADELVLDRSSPAVKSALKILLEYANSSPASRRRRNGSVGVSIS
jgi:hypothetical protein